MKQSEAWRLKWEIWGEAILVHDLLECAVPSCPVPHAPPEVRQPKQCLESLGPEIRCEKAYDHGQGHRHTGPEFATVWSTGPSGHVSRIPLLRMPELRAYEKSPAAVKHAIGPKRKHAKPPLEIPATDVGMISIIVPEPTFLRHVRLDEELLRVAEHRRDHYAEIRARQRVLAGIPEDYVPEVHIAEHSHCYPSGRSIRPKQVPWVDRDWNG